MQNKKELLNNSIRLTTKRLIFIKFSHGSLPLDIFLLHSTNRSQVMNFFLQKLEARAVGLPASLWGGGGGGGEVLTSYPLNYLVCSSLKEVQCNSLMQCSSVGRLGGGADLLSTHVFLCREVGEVGRWVFMCVSLNMQQLALCYQSVGSYANTWRANSYAFTSSTSAVAVEVTPDPSSTMKGVVPIECRDRRVDSLHDPPTSCSEIILALGVNNPHYASVPVES